MVRTSIKGVFLFAFISFGIYNIFSTVFRKTYHANVKRGIYALSFNDTIEWVRDYKDDLGPGIETKFLHADTPYCFSGSSPVEKEYYLDFARNGDVLIKARNSDTFYIVRGKSSFGFILSECK